MHTGKGNPSIIAILEENKRLKQDKERLAEKLSQSKGALRDTLDRLHKKDASTLSPLPSRRIFSSAVAGKNDFLLEILTRGESLKKS